ncbi:MAG TPA: methyltransferase domain-containing protein [Solirubrobacteraceae bacterium]
MEDDRATLSSSGFVRIDKRLLTAAEAFALASSVIEADYGENSLGPLSIIGDFVLPPVDGPETRDFQTLHFDFGLPIDPKLDQDVARYTALYIPAGTPEVSAITRLVPLGALLQQRTWPTRFDLLERLVAYGRTHGAWDDTQGYVEGSLARIVEAAAGTPPDLPSVKLDHDFLCGMEFDSHRSELAFFAGHGLRVEDVAIDLALRPGELLVFDNFALAHGRRGTRAPGELCQRVFGHSGLAPAAQRELRSRVLSAFSGRQPTSHERRADQPWDASYVDGPPPWDIGRPQPAILSLAGEGAFTGAVLDAGCGTGEHALHVASLGLHVLGVDVAETALSIAREKAAVRGIDADFAVADALHLNRLGRAFETVLDCGLFHTFDSDERRDYVASLASVTSRGGYLYVLCFSDVGPGICGPHPVSQEKLRAAFERCDGWSVARVSPDRIETRFAAQGVPAWLAKIERV